MHHAKRLTVRIRSSSKVRLLHELNLIQSDLFSYLALQVQPCRYNEVNLVSSSYKVVFWIMSYYFINCSFHAPHNLHCLCRQKLACKSDLVLLSPAHLSTHYWRVGCLRGQHFCHAHIALLLLVVNKLIFCLTSLKLLEFFWRYNNVTDFFL